MFKRIFTEILVLLLVVHVYISFAQQSVTLKVTKTNIERDLTKIKLFQNQDTEPLTILDTTVTPWVWTGTVDTMNGKASFYAIPVDTAGQEGSRSPEVIIDPPPNGSDISITVIVE